MSSDKAAPRIAIYTAVFGGYDPVKIQPPQMPQADFFYFTDQPADAPGWTVVSTTPQGAPRHQAKFFKLQPHHIPQLQDYDYTIWIDGSIRLIRPDFTQWIIDQIGASGWAIFRHPEMNCLYDEAAAMIRTKKYQDMPIAEQAAHYRSQGCPAPSGLMMCSIIARDMRNTQWISLCDAWWEENERWTLRDQVSLPYVLWRDKGALEVIDADILNAPHFRFENAFRRHEYEPAATD